MCATEIYVCFSLQPVSYELLQVALVVRPWYMCREQTLEQVWHEYSKTSSPSRELSAVCVLLQHSQGLRHLSRSTETYPQSSVSVRYSISFKRHRMWLWLGLWADKIKERSKERKNEVFMGKKKPRASKLEEIRGSQKNILKPIELQLWHHEPTPSVRFRALSEKRALLQKLQKNGWAVPVECHLMQQSEREASGQVTMEGKKG